MNLLLTMAKHTGNKMITLAIVGSRSFTDYTLLKHTLEDLYPDRTNITEIVSGGARGADMLAERYAKEYGIRMIRLSPRWITDKVYNPRAGFERNEQIVKRVDHVIAFWDGKSTGTRDSINHAKRLKRRLDVVSV